MHSDVGTNNLIWGARGHARVVRDWFRSQDTDCMLVVDNDITVSPPWSGCRVMAGMSELERMLRAEQIAFQSLRFVAAIGGARGRDRMAIEDELTRRGAIVLDVRHPTALVSSSAVLGSACQLLMGTIVGPVARLGRSVIMNTGSQLDHDCVVGDGVHLGPGAVVAGEVTVGDRTFIGAGAVILPRVTIGCDVVVGAGAVVTVNIADGLVVSGVPAKKVSHVVE